jgi:hypothetical protein
MANRDRFKATPVQTMKKQDAEVQSVVYDKGERTPWLKIEPGSNKFRILPAHPDSNSFVYPRSVWWLQRDVTYEKDGEQITERKKRPVFNAKIHGGAQKDIVDEYIKFATKVFSDEIEDEKELQDKIASLTAYQKGINLKQEWILYAQKYEGSGTNAKKSFGLLAITNGVKNKLNELAIAEDDVDNPITTDPFTDPDNGKAVIIKYDNGKNVKGKDMYKVNLEWKGDYTLTDDELDTLEECDSLNKMYHNVYRLRDFDLAVEGIRIFDEENGYGIFEHDEFIELIEKLRAEWPEEESSENEESHDDEEKVSNSSESVKTLSEGDEFDDMDRIELKKFIKDNDISFIVKRTHTDDDIRNGIRDSINGIDEVEEAEEEEERETVKNETSGKSPLELAQERLNKHKK